MIELLADRPACADRLDLVDAAFDRPGKAGKSGRPPTVADELARLCRRCPIAAQCLTLAVTHGEYGVWGGTSPNQRTRRGSLGTRARVSPDGLTIRPRRKCGGHS